MTHALEIKAEQQALDCVLLPLHFHYPSEDKSVFGKTCAKVFRAFPSTLSRDVWFVSTVETVSLYSKTQHFLPIIHDRLRVAMEGKSAVTTMQLLLHKKGKVFF